MELLEEGLAQAISGDFRPQNVADTLWAYAKMGREPRERLMGLLEERAETISGKFKSKHVSTTLWAYGKMGRKQGERLMGLLEERAEAMFTSLSVSDTWAYAEMGDDGEEAGGTADGAAGGADGDDIWGVHLAGCFRSAVRVCENGVDAGGGIDGAAGGAGGGDIRGVHLTECFRHVVGVCGNGVEAWGTADGAAGGAVRGDIRGDTPGRPHTSPVISTRSSPYSFCHFVFGFLGKIISIHSFSS